MGHQFLTLMTHLLLSSAAETKQQGLLHAVTSRCQVLLAVARRMPSGVSLQLLKNVGLKPKPSLVTSASGQVKALVQPLQPQCQSSRQPGSATVTFLHQPRHLPRYPPTQRWPSLLLTLQRLAQSREQRALPQNRLEQSGQLLCRQCRQKLLQRERPQVGFPTHSLLQPQCRSEPQQQC